VEKQMAKRKPYLSTLCSVSQNIISEASYDKVLSSLVKGAATCLNIKASSVRLLDKTGQRLEIAAAYGLSKSYLKKGPVEIAKSPIDKQALQGKVIQIKDVTKDRRFQYPREAKKEGIKSVICLPLWCRKRLLGVLRVYSEQVRTFDDEEVMFIKTLALQGAAALEHTQRHRRLKQLNTVGRAITSQLKMKRIPQMICQSATDEMFAKGASVMLIDNKTRQLKVVASCGLSEEFVNKGPVEADKSIGECLRAKAVVIEDAAKDKRVQYPKAVKKEGIRSIICVPLKLRDKAIGALRIYTGYKYRSNAEDIEFLSTLADFGVTAIENANLYEHVRRDYEDLARDVWKWYGWGEHPPSV
jgi:signal transduction protein with GAF and PtsI domain